MEEICSSNLVHSHARSMLHEQTFELIFSYSMKRRFIQAANSGKRTSYKITALIAEYIIYVDRQKDVDNGVMFINQLHLFQ